jgi:hypothetical protein
MAKLKIGCRIRLANPDSSILLLKDALSVEVR